MVWPKNTTASEKQFRSLIASWLPERDLPPKPAEVFPVSSGGQDFSQADRCTADLAASGCVQTLHANVIPVIRHRYILLPGFILEVLSRPGSTDTPHVFLNGENN